MVSAQAYPREYVHLVYFNIRAQGVGGGHNTRIETAVFFCSGSFFFFNASSSSQGGFSAHFAQCSYAPGKYVKRCFPCSELPICSNSSILLCCKIHGPFEHCCIGGFQQVACGPEPSRLKLLVKACRDNSDCQSPRLASVLHQKGMHAKMRTVCSLRLLIPFIKLASSQDMLISKLLQVPVERIPRVELTRLWSLLLALEFFLSWEQNLCPGCHLQTASGNQFIKMNKREKRNTTSPGAVKLVLWRYWMHAKAAAAVTSEKQFHCTRLCV